MHYRTSGERTLRLVNAIWIYDETSPVSVRVTGQVHQTDTICLTDKGSDLPTSGRGYGRGQAAGSTENNVEKDQA